MERKPKRPSNATILFSKAVLRPDTSRVRVFVFDVGTRVTRGYHRYTITTAYTNEPLLQAARSNTLTIDNAFRAFLLLCAALERTNERTSLLAAQCRLLPKISMDFCTAEHRRLVRRFEQLLGVGVFWQLRFFPEENMPPWVQQLREKS